MKKYLSIFTVLVVLVGMCFVPTKYKHDDVSYPAPTPFHTIDMPSVEEMIQEFEATR